MLVNGTADFKGYGTRSRVITTEEKIADFKNQIWCYSIKSTSCGLHDNKPVLSGNHVLVPLLERITIDEHHCYDVCPAVLN